MSRLRRRFADTPAATLLTGLRPAVGPASRPLGGAMLTLLRLPSLLKLNWGFAPGAGKGAVPEAPRSACAPAALILARTTPILAEGQRFSGAEPD